MNPCSKTCIGCSSKEDLISINYSKFHKMCIVCAVSQIENKLMQCQICETKVKIVYKFIQTIVESFQLKELTQFNPYYPQTSQNLGQVISLNNYNPSLYTQPYNSNFITSNDSKKFQISANYSSPNENYYKLNEISSNSSEDYQKYNENLIRTNQDYSNYNMNFVNTNENYCIQNENLIKSSEDYKKNNENLVKSYQNLGKSHEVCVDAQPKVMGIKKIDEEVKLRAIDKVGFNLSPGQSGVKEEEKKIDKSQISQDPKKCQSCSIVYDYRMQIGNCKHLKCKNCTKNGFCGACDPNITCKTCKITCFLSVLCVHKYCQQCRKKGNCVDCKCFVCGARITDLLSKNCGHYLCQVHYNTKLETCSVCKSNIFTCKKHDNQTFFVQAKDRSQGYIHFPCCDSYYCISCRYQLPSKKCPHKLTIPNPSSKQKSPTKKK